VGGNGEEPKSAGGPRGFVRNAAAAVNIVGVFVGSVFGGFFLGYFLDSWLATSPAFTLGGSLLGTVAGVYAVFRASKNIMR